MIERFFVHEVDIVRAPPETDRYGDTRPDWASATSTTVSGWLTSVNTTEITDGREAISTEWSLSLPADVDIDAADRVQRGAAIYEIVGDVEAAATPYGTHHQVVRLRSVHG